MNLAQYNKTIINMEKEILRLLSNTTADKILDDVVLISTLETSKVTSTDIQERIAESKIIEKEVEEVRNSYKDVSTRGSILFFVIKDLSIIDPMYQYSL
jgi:dynein heavy chain, axonemal